MTSPNIPGGYPKIIRQIRSKGFLALKTLDPPLHFGYQITVHLFGLEYQIVRIYQKSQSEISS
jgi:hypothetical protein